MQKNFIRTFLYLNYWAIFLDALNIILLSLILFISLPIFIKFITGLIFLYTLVKALELHIKVHEKYRARSILLEKNRVIFRENTFEQFMGAPCGRMLVKEVLLTLNKYYMYKAIKTKYYKGFFADTKDTSIVIIPNPIRN